MARETRIICDCCGDDLTDGRYYIKVKPHWTSPSGAVVFAEDEEWYICEECLKEIGERVEYRKRPVDIEYEVKE